MDTHPNAREEMPVDPKVHSPAYYADDVRCIVPSCKKYRRDHRLKTMFLRIPDLLKEKWCEGLQRKCTKRSLYVCKDHINIERDCIKAKSGKLRLKQTASLSFSTICYENISPGNQQTACSEDEDVLSTTSTWNELPIFSKCEAETQWTGEVTHKSVSAKPCTRSVGTNANIKLHKVTHKLMPSIPERSELILSTTTSGSSTSNLSFYEMSTSTNTLSSSNVNIKEKKDFSVRHHILKMIKQNPKLYIGIPQHYYWLVDLLAKECNLHQLHILITLFKIRQNDTIQRISDHFILSKVTAQRLLRLCYTRLASYLQNFIYLPEPIAIKKTLPPVFKPRYANVQSIIDCFEIEIEKPTDPLTQAQTWFQYKACNTIKYLIACCPNGFISFISKGFGGRISDKMITEHSGFVEILPPGAVILADRGFKGLDTLLKEKNIKLLRPPSVFSKETPTKKEVIQSKIIASLRIHIERVIRRVREFRFLKPHSVVNHHHQWFLDECVIIACALANLQGDIIDQSY